MQSSPYALKDKIEKELERLVSEGIYEAFSLSKWAASIIPVIKNDGSIRICGDYKQTMNRVSECDRYPVPKTEDLFATLNNREKFSKLDLSHTYQQLLLAPESNHYLLSILTRDFSSLDVYSLGHIQLLAFFKGRWKID